MKLLRAFASLDKTWNTLQGNCVHYMCYRRIHGVPQNGPWKVLFFGSDDFAVESLKRLHEKYESKDLCQLEVVVKSKVLNKVENLVKKYAEEHSLPIRTWPLNGKVTDFHIGIIVSFGHLIPTHLINSFPLGMLNVHGSILPRWRGAAPISYSLMNGDERTGVTIMQIKPKKFDIGNIIAQETVDIGLHETLPELRARLATLGADLLIDTLKGLPQVLESSKPQDESNATYAPKITPQLSQINWNEMCSKRVYNLHRGLMGLLYLNTKFQDMTIKLSDIGHIEDSEFTLKFQNEPPGTVVYDKKKKLLIVKCKENSWISVNKVTVPKRPPMKGIDFSNGFLSGKGKKTVLFE